MQYTFVEVIGVLYKIRRRTNLFTIMQHFLIYFQIKNIENYWNYAAELPRRVFRDRAHPLDSCSEIELLTRYRFTREGIMTITDMIQGEIESQTVRNKAVPPCLQVLVALNFFATGSVQESTAAMHGLHASTISRSIHRVSEALCSHKNEVRGIFLIF